MEECLALLESLEHQSRDVGDFSQPLTILQKIDQALKKLSSQSEAGSASLQSHLESQFLFHCGSLLVGMEAVNVDLWEKFILLMRQIYMAAWLGQVS